MNTCITDHHYPSLAEAVTRLLSQAHPITACETVALLEADGRIIADDQRSGLDIPDVNRSAMDGYALRSVDVTASRTRLRISQRIPAGATPAALEPGTAARIYTGADVPAGADAVVIQERTTAAGDHVIIDDAVKPWQHIRCQGSQIQAGTTVLTAGTRLAPPQLALLASLGIAEVNVIRRLKVAIISNGNELQPPGTMLQTGHIYNANVYALTPLLQRLGCEVTDLGIVEDDLASLSRILRLAAEQFDVIISSGGMSVGDTDHLKAAVTALGELSMWRVAIKPGKPFGFGRIGNCSFLGLPGNPLSALVTFWLLARPLLQATQGGRFRPPLSLPIIADFDSPRPDTRECYVPGFLTLDAQHQPVTRPHAIQDSSALISMVDTHGLIVIPAGQTVVRGDRVTFIPYAGLLG
ncbi:MAG: molybdopterin molybdotransferase MoeA [Gammaproteobacteria bacterium]|nr:molybdopterin molybdotransferase MoeA [Gammaproteobacteria bacterium]